MKKQKILFSPLLIILGILLLVYVLSMVGLFFWGFITSFKDAYLDITFGNTYGFPKQWLTTNYTDVFEKFTMAAKPGETAGFSTILINSLLYALGCAFFKTLVPCLTAYSCARFNFKTSKIVYTIVLITMIIPIVGSLPSELKVAYALGLHNHIWGLWIMAANMQGLYFFVMYSAFKALPMGYSEAAKIDGASNGQVLIRIVMPLIKNLFFTILLINFVEFWNNYQTPKVYLPYYPTLGYTLFYYANSNNFSDATQVIALAFIVATPVLLLFLIFQERLMGNLTMGGLKG